MPRPEVFGAVESRLALDHASRQPERTSAVLDTLPLDCTTLHHRAWSLLISALEHLNITQEAWQAAGPSLPVEPPSLSL